MVLALRNHTPFISQTMPLMAQNGATILRIVVKGGFEISSDGDLNVAPKQPEIVMSDVYWGEPGTSSVRYESDVLLEKPTTDLVINGHAHAPKGKPATAMDISLTYMGNPMKRLRITGDREWRLGLTGWYISEPVPFTKMPIVYERAFGGSDPNGGEARNRSGVGYSSEFTRANEGMPVPNIEFPDQLVQKTSDRPAPAGLGIISKHWEPRLSYAGTYDSAWLENQFPLLPKDFDNHFFQSVTPDQWIPQPTGGESITIDGLSPEGRLGFELPSCQMPLTLRYRDRTETKLMHPETVFVDADDRMLVITWSASADIHGDPFRLLQVTVGDGFSEGVGCGCAG